MKWPGYVGILVVILCAEGNALGCGTGPYCVLSFHLRNDSRHVHDDYLTNECPGDPPHTPPFGNWGVNSPENQTPQDRDQFEGWNGGHWNSCTARQDLYPKGNCSYYNHDGCTAQITNQGTNQYTNTLRQRFQQVSCPIMGGGGCQDLDGSWFTLSGEWLDLYELDPFQNWASDPDAFVDELLPPPLSAFMSCPDSNFCFPSVGFPEPAVSLFGADIIAAVWIHFLGGGFDDPLGACEGAGQPLP